MKTMPYVPINSEISLNKPHMTYPSFEIINVCSQRNYQGMDEFYKTGTVMRVGK